MFVIGVTGGIGSGKSTVARILGEWGIPVIDADKLSSEVTAVGGEALPELAAAIGGRIINEEGGLNREKLADLIFTDRTLRDKVNAIIHAHVLDKIGSEIEAWTEKKKKAVVLDVPIPVKEGFLDRSHFVVAVTADDETRIERLVRRGLREGDARRRLAVQLSQDAYVELADAEIKNDGDLNDLERAVEDVLLPELKKRGVKLKKLPERGGDATLQEKDRDVSGSDIEAK